MRSPTLGKSLVFVDVVFVTCGFKGLSFWYLRCSGAVEGARSLRSLKRNDEVENRLAFREVVVAMRGRKARHSIELVVILILMVNYI